MEQLDISQLNLKNQNKMLGKIGRQLGRATVVTTSAIHGQVVLFLVFAFVLSGWLVYQGVTNQVQAFTYDLDNQVAVEVAQIE